MLGWLKSLFRVPTPAGPMVSVRAFRSSDATIARGTVAPDGEGWTIDAREKGTVRLFEVPLQGVDACMITYRAKVRSENLTGRAYLEMWCRLPGKGEFFSKGFHNAVKGTTDWASYEIPFYLKKGQAPDLIKLNLVVEGTGKIGLKEIELLKTPLAF
jgi:hypothetical protein